MSDKMHTKVALLMAINRQMLSPECDPSFRPGNTIRIGDLPPRTIYYKYHAVDQPEGRLLAYRPNGKRLSNHLNPMRLLMRLQNPIWIATGLDQIYRDILQSHRLYCALGRLTSPNYELRKAYFRQFFQGKKCKAHGSVNSQNYEAAPLEAIKVNVQASRP